MSAGGMIARRPWLLVVAAFLLLIVVWTVFLNIAVRNKPKEVPLDTPTPRHHEQPMEGSHGQ